MRDSLNSDKIIRRWLIMGLFAAFSLSSLAQVTITGRITDQNNEPLPGANVVVKNTTVGTVTDLDGNYRLEIPEDNVTVVYSYIGYSTREVFVGELRVIDVILPEDIAKMEEVVVIGYGTQKKIDLSGSVAVVDADDLESLPIKSAGEALKGRAAGVYVKSNTGQPGASPTILIRGQSSISAGNSPLIVVDGVQGVSLNDIDFNDIVSFNVLKDAASAAIYGSAGANGVILITTRRGQAGKTNVNFNFYTGWQVPPKKLDVLGPQDALDLIREIDVNDEIEPFLSDFYQSNFSIDTTNLINTDWQDELFRVAPMQNYSLSFSGGQDKFAYRVSAGYLDQVGFVKPSEFQRYSARANLDYRFSDKLKMVTDFSVTRRRQRSVTTGNFAWNGASVLTALNTLPFIPIYDESGGYFINPFQPNIDTPTAGIQGVVGYGYNTKMVGKYGLSYEIIPGLTYNLDLMANISVRKNHSYRSRYHTDIGRQSEGTANSSSGESFRWDMNHLLNYSKSFGNHNVDLMGGFITLTTTSWSNSSTGQGFPTDTIPHVLNWTYPSVNEKYNGNSSTNEYAKYSYIGRINYNYNTKYYFQANLRIDGSSRFGKNYRWGTFPSASVAWRISKEPFMQNIAFLDEMKLRFTYGTTGNDAFANYLHTSTYRAGHNYPIWGTDEIAVGYGPSAMANPNLRWEESVEKDLGFDMVLWRGRLNLTLDGYIKDSKDLLYNSRVPAHTGFSTAWVNIGKVRVSGFEFQLTTHNVSTPDFSWVSTLTYSMDKNEVKSLGELSGEQFSGRDNESVVAVGQPINSMWGWIMDGIFQNQAEIDALASEMADGETIYYQSELTAPGDIKYRNTNGFELDSIGNVVTDVNGNPVQRIDDNDRTFIGKPNPDFYFGIDNTFRYKNVDFSFFFQGMYGSDILSLTRREIERMDHYFNFSAVVLDRWREEGQETDVPRATISDPNRNNDISTRWIEDGSFIRIKYVSLGYKLPSSLLDRWKIRSARIYVTAENLLTLTNYSLYDPEIATNSRGTDMGGYPQARTFMLGVNLGF